MTQGIVFYNYGRGCLSRLAVAVYSLRKFYSGNVTILSDGDASDAVCRHFQEDKRLGVDVKDCFFDVSVDKNHHYLSKCRVHELTPYDCTIYIDSDTLTVGTGIEELFPIAEKHQFAVPQFSNWLSSGRNVSRRLMQWENIGPSYIQPALEFGPAINTGVFAFVKTSEFMNVWFKVARRGRHNFIPDEISCQLIIPRYPHKVVGWWYNASCKFDDVADARVKLIHYHGRKHCREGFPFHSDKWITAYEEVLKKNIAEINTWTPADDRKLKYYHRFIRPKLIPST